MAHPSQTKPPTAIEREIPRNRPSSSENRLVAFYEDSGMTFVLPSKQMINDDIMDLGRLPDLGETSPRYPIKLPLNVAWSISARPSQELETRVATAILFQAGLGGADLTICDRTLPRWDPTAITKQHKCMFSTYFATRATDKSSGPAAPFALMLWNAMLDNVALFRAPKLVTLHFKETSIGTDKSETQKWYTDQGCTNCLAAGIWISCTHHINAEGMHQQGSPTAEVKVPASTESTWDQRCSGHEGLREAIKATQLMRRT